MKRVLTPEERQKLKAVHEQVLAANPALAAERDALKAERKAARANKGEGTDLIALHEKAKAFRAKLADAMVAADPSVKDILVKIEGARHRKGKA